MTKKQLNILINADFKREIKTQNISKERGDNEFEGRKKFKHIAKRKRLNYDKVLDEYERADGGVGFIISYSLAGSVRKLEHTPAGATVIHDWTQISTGGL